MKGYELAEGLYQQGNKTEDELWDAFNWLFSSYSRNDTSYKFILLKAIINCFDKKDYRGRLSFDILFKEFTLISWNLIVKYNLLQKAPVSDGRRSSLENVIIRAADFDDDIINRTEGEKERIFHEVKQLCKQYVVGALYTSTNQLFYSFSKPEEWLEINPCVEEFIRKNKIIIENLNYNKWAKFYARVNGQAKAADLKNAFFSGEEGNFDVYRRIIDVEFKKEKRDDESKLNTFELLMIADSLDVDEESLEEEDVEEELYKDYSHMREYLKDPILLINHLKKEKGI